MPNCFIEPKEWEAGEYHLSREDIRHLIKVLRLPEGAEVTALNGTGGVVKTVIKKTGRDAYLLQRSGEPEHLPEPFPRIVLLSAIPKGARMDLLIEKTTELGVSEIQPVECEHSVVSLTEEAAAKRIDRWQRISRMAAEQSGRSWLPCLHSPVSFEKALLQMRLTSLQLCAAMQTSAQSFHTVSAALEQPPKQVTIWIGPEGDFSENEYSLLNSSGVIPLSLGPLTLRVETAAITAVALCSTYWRKTR